MTKKRKYLYATILALGGIALMLDRVMLATSVTMPSTVEATVSTTSDAAQGSMETSSQEGLSIPEMPYPENLPPYDSRFAMRDIFAPPFVDSKTGRLRDDAHNHGSDIDRRTNTLLSDTFKAQHKLDAILNGPRLKIAVIDGGWVYIGDILDGCKLKSIDGISVKFSCRDGSAILKIPSADKSIPD